MGLLDYFKNYFHDVDVYSLETVTGNWDTTEKEYPSTPTKVISGYIQPLSGSEVLKNQSLDKVTIHKMYTKVDNTINDTDRILYGGKYYHITYNPPEGSVSNTADHKEILLSLQR